MQPPALLPLTEAPLRPAAVPNFHRGSESSICLLTGFSNKLLSLSLILKSKLQAVGEKTCLQLNSPFLSEAAKRRKVGPIQLLGISGQGRV